MTIRKKECPDCGGMGDRIDQDQGRFGICTRCGGDGFVPSDGYKQPIDPDCSEMAGCCELQFEEDD